MKIANKISISFLSVVLILTGIAVPIFYLIAKDSLQKSIYNNLDTAVVSRANHIETYLKMLEISVGQLSKSTALENLLKINGKGDPRQADAFAQAMMRLKRTKEANPAIAEFMLMDKAGKVAVSSNESSIGSDKSADLIFLGGQKGSFIKDVYFSEVYKEPLLAVSTPFLDSQTDELLGVLAARVRLNDLNNIVTEKTGMGDTGKIYIVNKYGYMATPARFKEDVVLKQMVDTENVRKARLHKGREHPLSGEKKINVFPDYRGVLVLGAHEYIPQMQWVVLAEIDAKEAFAPLSKLRLIFLIVLFIVPIAAWLLGIFLAKLITGPLQRLHKGTEMIGFGNLDYKVGTNAKDEVGQLSRAFDTMTESLKQTTVSINTLNKEIAERKASEEALRESQERYRALVDNTILGVTVIDTDYKIITTNTMLAKLFNKPASDFVGKDCFREYEKREAVCPHCPGVQAMASGKTTEVETQGLRDDGSHFSVRNRAIPFFGPDGVVKGFIELVEDITERKKAEEKLSKALEKEIKTREIMTSMLDDTNRVREELEGKLQELKRAQDMLVQSEKLASLGSLVSAMAHEVNNPLMIISGNAQLCLMEDIQNDEVKNNLKIIFEECHRAKDIIQRLLKFSRPSKGETKEVDINKSIEATVSIVAHQFKLVNVEIKRNYLKNPPLISIDEQQMQEVFINLINNASEAMPGGGAITITTSLEGDFFRIDFKDTGCGMSEEAKKKLFEPFFTTKEKGTGLGLAVCYGIIKAHNGELKFESKLNKGITATVLLPLGGGKA